jgi:alanine racemase
MEAFERGAQGIAGARSLSNSAATLWHPAAHFDWVRPGIIMYGASPSGVTAAIEGTGLQPAMTLASELIAVQTLTEGQTVGYGSSFKSRGRCASAWWRAVMPSTACWAAASSPAAWC